MLTTAIVVRTSSRWRISTPRPSVSNPTHCGYRVHTNKIQSTPRFWVPQTRVYTGTTTVITSLPTGIHLCTNIMLGPVPNNNPGWQTPSQVRAMAAGTSARTCIPHLHADYTHTTLKAYVTTQENAGCPVPPERICFVNSEM